MAFKGVRSSWLTLARNWLLGARGGLSLVLGVTQGHLCLFAHRYVGERSGHPVDVTAFVTLTDTPVQHPTIDAVITTYAVLGCIELRIATQVCLHGLQMARTIVGMHAGDHLRAVENVLSVAHARDLLESR